MRTIQEVCKDYLLLLKKEGKINLTKPQIEQLSHNSEDQIRIVDAVDKELYSTQKYNGQLISSERAWFIFCSIVVHEDVSTQQEIWNQFIEDTFKVIEFHQKSRICSRRGGGKTFMLALRDAFKMYLIPHYQIIESFNIPIMIESFFDVYREIIDNNEFLLRKKEGNNRYLIWSTKNCIYNGGRVKGVTLGSTTKSKHVNELHIDDIYGKTESNKTTNIDVKNFIKGDAYSITKRKKGRIVFIGTRDNTDDLYVEVAKDKLGHYKPALLTCNRSTIYVSKTGWACRDYPSVLDWEKRITFLPQVYSWAEVMQDKEEMGDFLWYREMQLEIKLDKTGLISKFLFDKVTNPNLKLVHEAKEGGKYVMVVDPSSGEGQYSDYAAICVIQVKDDQKIVRHLWHERLLPIIDPEGGRCDLTNKVADVFRAFNNRGIGAVCELFIENNSIGRILIQSCVKAGLDPIEHQTNLDKIKIIMESVEEFKRDSVIVIPSNYDDEFTYEMVGDLKKECNNYTLSEKNGKLTISGKGTHDDLVFAFLIAIYYSQVEHGGIAECICQN